MYDAEYDRVCSDLHISKSPRESLLEQIIEIVLQGDFTSQSKSTTKSSVAPQPQPETKASYSYDIDNYEEDEVQQSPSVKKVNHGKLDKYDIPDNLDLEIEEDDDE